MKLVVFTLLSLGIAQVLSAREVHVNSITDLKQAIGAARAGDHITLADGQYSCSDQIIVKAAGAPHRPITISAQTVGGVEIEGEAGFRLESPAAYVVIQGFVFSHKAGEMELAEGVHHCRVTRNVFELQVPNRRRARYLSVIGDDNEIDHNEFRDKSTEGQMVHVQGPGDSGMAQRTWIHHNYFHDFKNSRRNNSSALHIGSSGRSMSSAWSIVEYNLFVRTRGENEGAVCNKATDNVYRFNTFGEDSTELSLRHGKRCLVYGNYFLGGNGLRFFSHDHRIYSNYFTNCRPAITIGNGGATIPPGPLTSHERPERVHIVYNTLVNNHGNIRMQDRSRGLGARDLVVANNIIVGGNVAAEINGPLEPATWEGNILWNNDGGAGDMPDSGYAQLDPKLDLNSDSLYVLRDTSPAISQGVGVHPYVTVDVRNAPRSQAKDVGAQQLSALHPDANRLSALSPLTASSVGPNAPKQDRPWVSKPDVDVQWIAGTQSDK